MQPHNNTLLLLSGIRIPFLDPKPEHININDIAAGLGNNSHFGGQVPKFFSIAEHSMLTMKLVLDATSDNELAFAGLLHDASEAITGDFRKPIKDNIRDIVPIEKKIQQVIFEKYGLSPELLKAVKPFDIQAQEIEYQNFYFGGTYPLHYYTPEEAIFQFLIAYKRISKLTRRKAA
ncbi:MAG TPA: hypothetical protein VGQ59_08315 [Cyclobacteriaceae bacterium]|jgi:hypothetical protein|nr:hypothetical protein [Cyclobacteriaceae bacterium]